MRSPHTSYRKRTKLRIVLRDGTVFTDRFVDKKSGCMVLEEAGRINISDIKNTGILKDRNLNLSPTKQKHGRRI